MRIIGIVLRVIVGLAFAFSGVFTIIDPGYIADQVDLPSWFLVLTGVLKLSGGLGVLAGFRIRQLSLPSGLLLSAIMVGAIVAHLRVDDPVSAWLTPAVLLVLTGTFSVIAFREDHALRDSLNRRYGGSLDRSRERQTNA